MATNSEAIGVDFIPQKCSYRELCVFNTKKWPTRMADKNTWDWVRVVKSVLFSATKRFCDVEQTLNCMFLTPCSIMRNI